MKNFPKAKACERLLSELGKCETEYNITPNYQTVPYTVNLFPMDIGHILDVLAKAIAEERQ